MNDATDSTAILQSVLDRWKTAVDKHEPEQVASAFTEDAIFQGLRPYSVGRKGIAEYYGSQPAGMTAGYQILQIKRFADDLVLGYLDVTFSFIERAAVKVKLGVLVQRLADGWYIAHYQVSRLDRT
jgi:uncharacterized protein (TIGR02246 family)